MEDQNKQNNEDENNAGLTNGAPDINCCSAGMFEIRVKGQLDSRWSEWLEGLGVKLLDNGEMILFGRIVDQAALIGIMNKLCRLNLTIKSVNEVSKTQGMDEK